MTDLYLFLFLFWEVKVGHLMLKTVSGKGVSTFGCLPAVPLREHFFLSQLPV